MTTRWLRIAGVGAATAIILGDVVYRMLKAALSDLAAARLTKDADALGSLAVFIVGCAGYFVAEALMRRRGIPGRPPLGVTAVLIFVALFIFINAAPDWSHHVPAAVYFVAQAVLWNIAGILVLQAVRNELSFAALTARLTALSVAALQSVVGVLGATYAGDPAAANLAAVTGVASLFAMIALARRSRWLTSGPPAAAN